MVLLDHLPILFVFLDEQHHHRVHTVNSIPVCVVISDCQTIRLHVVYTYSVNLPLVVPIHSLIIDRHKSDQLNDDSMATMSYNYRRVYYVHNYDELEREDRSVVDPNCFGYSHTRFYRK